MARSKKKKKFRAVTAVKAAARKQVGMPPPTRRDVESKRPREEKHKSTLGKLLQGLE
jgi:hypothetical protein